MTTLTLRTSASKPGELKITLAELIELPDSCYGQHIYQEEIFVDNYEDCDPEGDGVDVGTTILVSPFVAPSCYSDTLERLFGLINPLEQWYSQCQKHEGYLLVEITDEFYESIKGKIIADASD